MPKRNKLLYDRMRSITVSVRMPRRRERDVHGGLQSTLASAECLRARSAKEGSSLCHHSIRSDHQSSSHDARSGATNDSE